MTAEMSVQITLALANNKKKNFFLYPSAETGRQGKLKFY
jgi:hypothetical protein